LIDVQQEELKKWEKQFSDLANTFSNSISTLQRAAPGSSTTLMFSPRNRKESVVDDASSSSATTSTTTTSSAAPQPPQAASTKTTHGSGIAPKEGKKDEATPTEDETRSSEKRRGSM